MFKTWIQSYFEFDKYFYHKERFYSKSEGRSVVSDSLRSHGLYSPCNSSGQNIGLGTLSLREGNGTPLQCSCLENPRDGGAWWAAIYGVTQSRTRVKQLSSSSSLSFLQGNLPDPGIKPRYPTLQADSLPAETQGKPFIIKKYFQTTT